MILGYYFVRLGSPEGSTGHLLIYPFGGGDESYPFYSPAHLLDFLNHQVLASPVNVVLWMTVAVFLRKMVSFKEPVVKFLVLLSLCSLGFALLVDPKLGYARDWDLFAFTGLGATILALFLIVDSLRDRDETDDRGAWQPAYGRRKERTVDLRRVSVALVATSVVSTLPWIWVNASPQKAVARFEDLLRMDRRARGHGYETLACYSRDRGEHERSVKWWKDAIAVDPIPRYLGALGNAYRRLGDYDKAIEAYHRSLRMASRFPGAASVYKNLGDVLAKIGRLEEAAIQLRQSIDLKPGRTDVHRSLGMILGRLGRYQEAVPHLEMALASDPGDAALYRALTICHAAAGSKEDAGTYLETYLSFRPEDARKMKEILDSIEIGVRVSMPAESREVDVAPVR
jgi:Flp pilus assembly protein TadD